MTKLIILRGNSGSGKTTVAKELQKKYVRNTMIISQDMVRYFDLPFEETLRRHQARPKSNEFGEEEMRGWWREKDYIGFIKENVITAEETLDEIVERVYRIHSMKI